MIVATQHPGLDVRIVSARALDGVRAGSALVWYEGRLLVVQDDATSVVWVDVATGQTERLVLEGTGEALEKKAKPDFEVAFLGPGREVTILGSGSSATRRRRAVVELDTNVVTLYEEGRLFDVLEEVMVHLVTSTKVPGTFVDVRSVSNLATEVPGTLENLVNLEGGVISSNLLRLFNRGSGATPSAMLDFELDVFSGAPPRVVSANAYDLGQLNGVPLHFTDATLLGGRLAYVAVAEDTPNAIDDGPVVGVALGFIGSDSAYWAPLMEASGELSTRKVEGIAMDPQSGVVYAVTDPDDPDKPAELLTIAVTGND